MEKEKHVDESWKESVETEKKSLEGDQADPSVESEAQKPAPKGQEDDFQLSFINYISSLTFQALIFLGEIPHPGEGNKIESNLVQAKFVIDTLIILRDKTKGNLTQEEDNLLNASIYELQVKYVEHSKKKGTV